MEHMVYGGQRLCMRGMIIADNMPESAWGIVWPRFEAEPRVSNDWSFPWFAKHNHEGTATNLALGPSTNAYANALSNFHLWSLICFFLHFKPSYC